MNSFRLTDWLSVAPGSDISGALATRAGVFEMIDTARDAVLAPKDPGGVPQNMRCALAVRIAGKTGADALAAQYRDQADDITDLDAVAADDARVRAILAFVDRVAADTRNVESEDLDNLRGAGVEEPDIVRLCELVAFVAFETRVAVLIQQMEAA